VSRPETDSSPEVVQLLRLLRRSAAEVECVVAGDSMASAIPDGATVRLQLDGATGAAPGTAVGLLLGGDSFSIHRLIWRGRSRRAQGFVVTHGDGNVFCDAPQRESALLGTVAAVRVGDGSWSPVPPARRQRLFRRLVTGSFERLMCGAIELSPRLGLVLKDALVLVVTPFVWLRPYEAGRHRATSRLAGVLPVPPR